MACAVTSTGCPNSSRIKKVLKAGEKRRAFSPIQTVPSATSSNRFGTKNNINLFAKGYLCSSDASTATPAGTVSSAKVLLFLRNKALHPATNSAAPSTGFSPAESRNNTKKRSNSHGKLCNDHGGEGRNWSCQ